MDVTLVMFKSDGDRRDFPLSKSRIVVGRKNTCDLRIPLTSVSRQHCELWVEGDRLRLRDLGSSNGTYHNSSRVLEAVLAAGDEVVVGPVVFIIVIDGEPTEIKPVRTVLDEASDTGQSPAMPGTPGTPGTPGIPGASDQVPEALEASGTTMPRDIEVEQHTPTVQLDDPIAALEALADAEDDDVDLPGFDLLDDDDDHHH